MSDAASGFVPGGRTQVVDPDELVPVDVYRDRVLSGLHPLEPIELGLPELLGLVLAEDVVADVDLPPFANAAMDGFAVRAADVQGASRDDPARLRVVGEVAAGDPGDLSVEPGTAVRIMTGAPVPRGADAVVPVEVTAGDGTTTVVVLRGSTSGEHVRPAGTDVRVGTRVLKQGRRIRAADIGMLAALGRSRATCHPRPRVVILSTGNELVRTEDVPGPGQLRDSNGPMLAALVRQVEAVPFWAGIVRDERSALVDAFDSNLGHADMFVTTGGVSAGAHDHVRDVLAMLGDVEVAKVAMKPGMPQVHGRIRGVPVFALPGNPVSAFVSFEVFVRPALRLLQGRLDLDRPTITAKLADDVTTPRDKRTFVRVRLRQENGRWLAVPARGQASYQLAALVGAHGLAEIPEDRTSVRAGQPVKVHVLVEP